jgi:hypothetical protein
MSFIHKLKTVAGLLEKHGLRVVCTWTLEEYIPTRFGIPNLRASRLDQFIYIGPQYGKLGKWLLYACGIRHCVNMREEFNSQEHGLALEHYCYPPVHTSFADQLRCAAGFIEEAVSHGHPVYVHCKNGRHRSTAAVIAYLVAQGRGLDNAIQWVKQKRDFELHARHYQYLKEFAAHIRSSQIAK